GVAPGEHPQPAVPRAADGGHEGRAGHRYIRGRLSAVPGTLHTGREPDTRWGIPAFERTHLMSERRRWREYVAPELEERDGDGWYVPEFDPEKEGAIAVGTDIIEIARIQRSLNDFGERFLKRVYTER